MKKLNLIAAAIALAASSTAFAATLSDGFDVTINFTSSCQVKTAATDMTFTYAAFGPADSKNTSTVFKCSRGVTPTFSFDNAGATQTGQAAPVALGTALTGEGLIGGIRYTLAGTSSKTQTGTAAAAGAGGTGGTDGSADEYTVAITADIGGNQAGTSGATGGTQTRTLVITY
jgi:hypothetical protein